jgi:hypothetical protein
MLLESNASGPSAFVSLSGSSTVSKPGFRAFAALFVFERRGRFRMEDIFVFMAGRGEDA